MRLLLGYKHAVIVTERGFLMATFEVVDNELPRFIQTGSDQEYLFPAWLSPTGWELLLWGDIEPEHRQALELTGG